ncbi:MAG: tetratricopeptide repeat protein [Candidatus Marithrix sp.]
MSLLMDALKKADEAVDTKLSTNINKDSKLDIEQELLPQFKIDSQLVETPEQVFEQDDTAISDKWDDDFLPQFKDDKIQNNELDNLSKSTSQNNLAKDNIKLDKLIEPPSQTEIKLPNTEKLQNIDEIQTLFSLTNKEQQDSNAVADLQIPIINIDEQSPLEAPISEETVAKLEPKLSKKEYQPKDAQQFFTASNPPSSSKRTTWLLVVLGIIVVGMGAGYYYLEPLLNQSSSLKLGNSQRPKFNPTPVKEVKRIVQQPIVNVKPIIPIKPIIKSIIQPVKKITKALAKPIVPVSPVKPNKIHTLRKITISSVNKNLSKAYTALQTGNKKIAKRTYQKVLHQDKNNRDALLGLAALAIQNNSISQAQQYYQQILRNYPKDIHAQVGLINSFGNAPKNETKLKLLLRQTPKAAYIHFSLGNLYANQQRWELAQQAYFNAMRYDNKHAGYAYNLAISLDRINQPKTALTYYQLALDLASNSIASFNPKVVRKRINTLMRNLK